MKFRVSGIWLQRHFSFLSSKWFSFPSPYLSCVLPTARQMPTFWRCGPLKTHTAPTPLRTHPSHCQRAFASPLCHTRFQHHPHWLVFHILKMIFFLWNTASSLFLNAPRIKICYYSGDLIFLNHFFWYNNDFLEFLLSQESTIQLLPSSEIAT